MGGTVSCTNPYKPSRNSVGCNYAVQPDRLMRQALSISFNDKAVSRAELRATMSMSGVFDFHHMVQEQSDNESVTSDAQGEST